MSTEPKNHLSLSAASARNLATATVTVPQVTDITPRWLHRLLPWVDVDGGVYRVNRVAKAKSGQPVTCYVGAAWSRAGEIKSKAEWEAYLQAFAARIASPVKITCAPAK